MARKTTGTTTTRNKKIVSPVEPTSVQPTSAPVAPIVTPELRKNVTAINTPKKSNGNTPVFNMDEEIRRRAYELYLERNGAAGDPNADWLIAEREVRARLGQQALAASQGRG